MMDYFEINMEAAENAMKLECHMYFGIQIPRGQKS